MLGTVEAGKPSSLTAIRLPADIERSSGYVSAPRRTRIGVRTYERLAMFAAIIPKLYIDLDWVVKEYLRCCKKGAWKQENMDEALQCFNLERIINTELQGDDAQANLTLTDLLAEGVGIIML